MKYVPLVLHVMRCGHIQNIKIHVPQTVLDTGECVCTNRTHTVHVHNAKASLIIYSMKNAQPL